MIKNENVFFNKWLKENNIFSLDFSGKPFPDASDREFWSNKFEKGIVACGEEYLNYDWPVIKATQYMEFVKSGDRLAQETPSFSRRRALLALLKAEILEYKGRFIPDIVDGLFLICEETYWGVSAHVNSFGEKNIPTLDYIYIDLFAAETAELLSLAYYLLNDELKNFCPEILTRIEDEINRRIIDVYIENYDMWWMGYTAEWVNNWSAWILSNVLTTFVFMPMDETKRAKGIAKTMTEMNFYYDIMLNDGGCDEGPTYWGASGAKFFEYCALLFDATKGKIDFFDDEKARAVFSYVEKAYIGNGFVTSYGDCIPDKTNFETIVFQIGKQLNDENLMRLAKEIKDTGDKLFNPRTSNAKRQIYEVVYKKEIEEQGPYIPKEKSFLPDLQVSAARENKWYLSCRGYNNFHSHSHNDTGNFMVFFDNKPVIVDVGCGTYTKETFNESRYSIWTMQSSWHNLPTVNGVDQNNSKSAKSDYFSFANNKTEIGIKDTYGEEAGLQNLLRSVDLNAGVSLCDRFAFENESNTVTEHFMTLLDVEIKENEVVLGNEFVLTCDAPCEISTEFKDFKNDVKLAGGWGTKGANRISFDFKTGKEFVVNFSLRRK